MAVSTTEDSIVFACYSKSCAPPPAGKGGSIKGGRAGGGVIRKSGGGDSSHTKSVARAGAKALSARFGTKRQGTKDTGNKSTTVAKAPAAAKIAKAKSTWVWTHPQKKYKASVARLAREATAKNRPGGVGGSSVGKARKMKSEDVKGLAKWTRDAQIAAKAGNKKLANEIRGNIKRRKAALGFG